MDEYSRFCAYATEDADLVRELHAIRGDEAAISERFSRELEFGTAGLRGILGAGTDRMNLYTVSRATNGLFDVITGDGAQRPVFVIGYDTRIKSDVFARRAARVLSGRGARVYLADAPIPVPLVSYAVRAMHADAGICITASHNPAEYNGYKVFGNEGAQLLEADALRVSEYSRKYDYFTPLGDDPRGEILPLPEEVFDAYFAGLHEQDGRGAEKKELKVVYTPLCGTGLDFVPRALTENGFCAPVLVPEQAVHDSTFPTCPKPNPEVREALDLAISLARECRADLVLGTDPDCDRVGVGVPTEEGFRLLTGNETGTLLLEWLLSRARREGRLTPDTLVCTTVVSAPMADAICSDYGVKLTRVLTGFKYIGEQICMLDRAGKKEDFLFGFEESYGCLASPEVRDKDACEACLNICRMAEEYRKMGKTLVDRLEELEARYGTWRSDLKNYAFSSPQDEKNSRARLSDLHACPPSEIAGRRVKKVADYLSGTVSGEGAVMPTGLPKSDMLVFTLADESVMMIRPSGTEPKVKVYLFACAGDEEAAQRALSDMASYADGLFGHRG